MSLPGCHTAVDWYRQLVVCGGVTSWCSLDKVKTTPRPQGRYAISLHRSCCDIVVIFFGSTLLLVS
jgi:hypothetical protein